MLFLILRFSMGRPFRIAPCYSYDSRFNMGEFFVLVALIPHVLFNNCGITWGEFLFARRLYPMLFLRLTI